MVKKIGTLTINSAETKTDVASDIGGFAYGILVPDIDCQISVNDNQNYITYNAMQQYTIPGPIVDLYIKGGSGTEKIRYWFFDC